MRIVSQVTVIEALAPAATYANLAANVLQAAVGSGQSDVGLHMILETAQKHLKECQKLLDEVDARLTGEGGLG